MWKRALQFESLFIFWDFFLFLEANWGKMTSFRMRRDMIINT